MKDPKVITSETELGQALQSFLNDHPLYTKYQLVFEEATSYLGFPDTILRECPVCESPTTWSLRTRSNADDEVTGFTVRYRCTHCTKKVLELWVLARSNDLLPTRIREALVNKDLSLGKKHWALWKFGQNPQPGIDPPAEVLKSLGDEVGATLKKGLTSLQHGFGIGAVAYFRRVLEDGTAALLTMMASKAEEEGETEAAEKIRAALSERSMEDQLSIAAKALPASLRPGGVNPLATMYDLYSENIHQKSDDEAVLLASRMYRSLEYVFLHWQRAMDQAAEYRKDIQGFASETR